MHTTIEIQNLKCGGCAATILGKLNSLEQVENVSVDTDSSTVSFGYQRKEDFHAVKDVLAKLGYPLANEKNGLGRMAKSYVSCAMGRIGG
ncbi:heavy-metal-associated domain-containing protein [Flavobacteriaceae bacterium TP-CH-4]|uniref:Heavy-metal-associated domain-containing protein n=1 Tax=Pelagihabitans pacificus TaxID=2696054 RepID=A0A967EDR2_9FLAO|nr:heavy-metal-associated domain-containing protein [Pelagihabitans pacificus]NHF59598.1 heavy-metal-associated domain-containing protein [Pelagihabitans pacificus]